jgi:type IV secretory pathway TraG/TraD family ATPase VirD4
MVVTIAGPRTGKTTSYSIPHIMAAPGPVIATSNKRDIVDATRGPRSERGRVDIYDPQQVYGVAPEFSWPPLSYVTDEVTAKKMAAHFAAGSRELGAHTDAFFDPAGQDLLTGFMLAASMANYDIIQVPTWLAQPGNQEPVEILRHYKFDVLADILLSHVTGPSDQRGGIYGTAQTMTTCLSTRTILPWIVCSDDRPVFDPDLFVRSGGTLYSISREGQGSTGPLVTALTVAVVEAAERYANQCVGGRLPTPLVGALDELANICRWGDLPDQYSHFGSKGIILNAILQNWAQGELVWGEKGMWKLWAAANIAIYGGGVKERAFTENMAAAIGEYERLDVSDSRSESGRSVSRSHHMRSIMPASDLESLPRGRSVIFASGARPCLVKTRPWMNEPYAPDIRASIDTYGPKAVKRKVHQ